MAVTNKKRIAFEWARFEKAVMPKEADAVQRQEMRRAFYAGAWATLQSAKEIGNQSPNEKAAVQEFEAMEAECIDFISRIGVDC